jgi:hypothetical protein
MKSIRQRGKAAAGTVALAMALGVLGALSPQPLLGQASTSTSNTQVPILIAVPIPCANEIAVLGGDLHILLQTTIDADGGTHLEVHFNPQGVNGAGLTSGNKYQGTGVTRYDLNTSGPPPFESVSVNNFNIVGQGRDNNMLMHFNTRMSIDANGAATATVSNFKAECK